MLFVATAGLNSYAGDKDEITLTVTSDGVTKDDAIKNALRTAIEQAYGAFVSANTTILNDELVKDEIVTVSNGSIKEYKILSEYEKPDGSGYGVTANATVSLPHLITYAKNHGSECEFAGNTFGMEMKLFEIQKENELKAIYNLIPTVRNLCQTSMQWIMKVDEPIVLKPDGEFNYDSYHNLSIKSEEVKALLDNIPSLSNSVYDEQQKFCVVHFELSWKRVGMKNQVAQYLYESLSKIGLDRDSFHEKSEKGYDVSYFMRTELWGCSDDDPLVLDDESNGYHYFRNNKESIYKAIMEINKAIRNEKLKFHILDNNGPSDFYALDFISLISHWEKEVPNNLNNARINRVDGYIDIYKIPNTDLYFTSAGEYMSPPFFWGINGTGLFKNLFAISQGRLRDNVIEDRHRPTFVFEDYQYTYPFELEYRETERGPSFSIYAIIPVSEIGRYSSFKIEAKK